jgi:hypothetical protein
VEGAFAQNEFAALTPDELHFLRVFIHCEGRIRDMEAALGVSYPTVKTHLSSIKNKLNLGSAPNVEPEDQTASTSIPEAPPASIILEELEQGRLSYKEALKLIKTRKKGADSGGNN